MNTWTRKPQEQEGEYYFNGKTFVTSGISENLTEEEIKYIVMDILQAVKTQDGIDYLQVYENGEGDKIFVIDQLNKSMLEGNGYTEKQKEEYNYFTIMFNHEY